MNIAPARLPESVARYVSSGDARPRAAMKLPNATTVSDGSGGNTFSIPAANASAR